MLESHRHFLPTIVVGVRNVEDLPPYRAKGYFWNVPLRPVDPIGSELDSVAVDAADADRHQHEHQHHLRRGIPRVNDPMDEPYVQLYHCQWYSNHHTVSQRQYWEYH